MRRALLFALPLMLAACDSTAPANPGRAYVGTWQLDVAAGQCWDAFALTLHISEADGQAGQPHQLSVGNGSHWRPAADTESRYPMAGGINFAVRRFAFDLWSAPEVLARFEGTDMAPRRMAGRFTDMDDRFRTQGATGQICSASATAERKR